MYTLTRTSDDYEPLVIVRPNGQTRGASVFRRRSPLHATMSLAAALDGLDSGQEVWVAPTDAPAVRDWLAGRGR
jgi:hypothetical protein